MPAPVVSTPVEKIGMQLRDLFPGLRLQFISLHDAKGDALWLSEGAIGPDEHSRRGTSASKKRSVTGGPR
jgi:hypothetical protein